MRETSPSGRGVIAPHAVTPETPEAAEVAGMRDTPETRDTAVVADGCGGGALGRKGGGRTAETAAGGGGGVTVELPRGGGTAGRTVTPQRRAIDRPSGSRGPSASAARNAPSRSA